MFIYVTHVQSITISPRYGDTPVTVHLFLECRTRAQDRTKTNLRRYRGTPHHFFLTFAS